MSALRKAQRAAAPLFDHVGLALQATPTRSAPPRPAAFDPVKAALGLWRISGDPRHAIPACRHFAQIGVELSDDLANSVVRFHSRLTFDGAKVPGCSGY